MEKEDYTADEHLVAHESDDWDSTKIFVSRIPAVFEESTLKRLLEDRFGTGSVVDVSLVYPRDDEQQEETEQEAKNEQHSKNSAHQPHRGFGFVTMDTVEHQQEALQLGTLRGGAKATSTKKHTIYLSPVVRDQDNTGDETNNKQLCYLWAKFRCPYGDECKFDHRGEGGCIEQQKDPTKKKGKCFAFKKGKCTRGDDCPYSHDVEVSKKSANQADKRPDSEKSCISWKSKGKCNKRDRCPYRHDEDVQKAALEKIERKKRKTGDDEASTGGKSREPLSIRIFGLSYETTEEDIRAFLGDCGPIMEMMFPTFEDSGRSKGYCGVLFQSPKAAAKAVELNGTELHGRWLSIQAGKMYLKQWEEHHKSRQEGDDSEAQHVGEFGQKTKKRRKHGF
jgi:RNA recognition motif-containing protein